MEHNFHLLHSHTFAMISIAVMLSMLLLAYISAAIYQEQTLRYWKKRRTIWFALGISALAIALLSPLEKQAHSSFSAHMTQHLLIGMFAPIALVMSAPVSLLLRSVPTEVANTITHVLHSKFFYCISHPVATLLLNIGGMYLLYLTPLYMLSLNNTALHYLMHWHFLIAGYLFAWSIIGPDPAPRRPDFHFRAFILFISIAAHAILTKLMYGQLIPSGTTHPQIEIQSAAKLMYYGGDIAELIMAIILFHKMNKRYSINVALKQNISF